MSTLDQIILNSDSNDEFLRRLMSSLVGGTRSSNSIPKGLDYNYFNSFGEFRKLKNSASDHTREILEILLRFCNLNDPSEISDISDPYLYSQVVDAVDTLLEQAERFFSDANKLSCHEGNSVINPSIAIKQSLMMDKDRIIRENLKDIPKPQVPFLFDIDNARNVPFKPKLKTKFHSKINYEPKICQKSISEADKVSIEEYFPHPYEFELMSLEFTDSQISSIDVSQLQLPDGLRPYVFIETEDQLSKMIKDLSNADQNNSEIAIDLEHHNFRSFQGLTCLMQISSRKKDYIVDTLALRLSLWKLGEIFADPKVVKVFHGCEQDILWLQRDFGLYVVNCFDSFVAAKSLHFPVLSLAHLVRHYCGINLDKKHQLSDWRQRPLPEDMISYAKSDTQYLLYIYDRLRLDVLKKYGVEGMDTVLASSRRLCLNRYEKEVFDPTGFCKLLPANSTRTLPSLKEFNPFQEMLIASLWNWRDNAARNEDESPIYIMSNAELVRLALAIPRTEAEILSCSPITDYVRSRYLDILHLVNEIISVGAVSTYQTQSKKDSETSKNSYLPSSPTAASKLTNDSIHGNVKGTIFTFTPGPQPIRNREGKDEVIGSPVLALEEMFRMAGWKTPLPPSEKEIEKSWSPLVFEVLKSHSTAISADNRQRMSKSADDLFRSIESDMNFEVRLRKIVQESGSSLLSEPTLAERSSLPSDDTPGLEGEASASVPDIPRSYEEIYKLSGKNRKKNKDKKRVRDGVDASIESDTLATVAAVGDELGDNDDEFDVRKHLQQSADQEVDAGIDGTVSFAREIGWLQSAEESQWIIEDHQKVLSYQQSADDIPNGAHAEEPSNSANSANSPVRKSFEKGAKQKPFDSNKGTKSSAIPPQSHNSNRASHGAANSNDQQRTSQQKNSVSYDYSKTAQPAMGALLHVKDGEEKPSRYNSGRGQQKGGGGRGRSQGNPYTDTFNR